MVWLVIGGLENRKSIAMELVEFSKILMSIFGFLQEGSTVLYLID